MISPRPWRKSVSAAATRCSKLRTSPSRWVARILWWVAGRIRPCRVSSTRVHMSRTGRRHALEIRAASRAASKKSRRPKEPPAWTTCTVTLDSGRPSSAAMVSRATIGDLRPDQISARSSRTSAMAELVSIGAWLTKAKSNSASTYGVSRGGTSNGGVAARNLARIPSSDSWSAGPGPQVTWRAVLASMACPKVSATTATPVGTVTTCRTPGMARTAARLVTVRTVPPRVGGRRTTQGLAPGTSRSRVYCRAPVTMARASTRPVGLPTRVCPARFLGVAPRTIRPGSAAAAARSP